MATSTSKTLARRKMPIVKGHVVALDEKFKRANRPPILFQWKQDISLNLNYEVKLMRRFESLILDQDGNPLWDFPNLNLTLSKCVEEFGTEAVMRSDHRIGLRDIRARMIHDADGVDRRPSLHAIQQLMYRWRLRVRCLVWKDNGTSQRWADAISNAMTQDMKDNNTTHGLRDLTTEEWRGLMNAGNGSCPKKSKYAKREKEVGE
ncbi:MAG: hypothetical protein M1834_009168 [Cirrosporium novae-zelandiae]|nr:MAG: hypothetical protein M1834_009168 [Cirrosporium novae-zelandiae]